MTINKFGELKLQLQSDIKILYGFDFPEEFSSMSFSNIKAGD